jgi:hypothetical protein
MRREGHVARIGEMRNAYNILVKNLQERDHLENKDVDRRIILEKILRKYGGKLWTGFMWLRLATSGGALGTR